MAVPDGASADLRAAGLAEAQCIPQLVEEHWHAVVELRCNGRNRRPRSHLGAAPQDDLVAIGSNEFMEHEDLSDSDRTA
jgi:hypothetical protein